MSSTTTTTAARAAPSPPPLLDTSTPSIAHPVATMEPDSPAPHTPRAWLPDQPLHSADKKPWRRALGLFLLGVVVVLWVSSSFLQSDLMADGEYNKAYFFTYINTAFFAIPLLPLYARHLLSKYTSFSSSSSSSSSSAHSHKYHPLRHQGSEQSLLPHHNIASASEDPAHDTTDNAPPPLSPSTPPPALDAPLTLHDTLKLSAKFAGLWFLANWLNASSFSNTSVASSTILTSTSSVFTLAFGAVAGTERFTLRKLLGVLASLAGIVLVSALDTRADHDKDRGHFPHKTAAQVALGDAMALLSAACYGLYATVLTKAIGDERRVNMPLFFGLIGALAAAALWPGLALLHWTGVEPFALPPTPRVTAVMLANAAISLVSDVCWAYAVLLTSPLVVTVGLALTIPLSLVGQILVNAQYSSPWYWLGAAVIVLSFVAVNYDEGKNPSDVKESVRAARGGEHGGGGEAVVI